MTDLSKMGSEDRLRFESLIVPEPNTGCWFWLGHITSWGYGDLYFNGKHNRAHRISYFLRHGSVPPILDHKCRVRCCVNPDHLRPATTRENVLWGIGFSAINAAKTHCDKGHLLAGENLYVRFRNGMKRRVCQICKRNRVNKSRARKRGLIQ